MLELSNVPKPLLEEVEKYLGKNPNAKILHVNVVEFDTEFLSVTYSVYIECSRMLSVFWLDSQRSEHPQEVLHNFMGASDIKVFLEHSELFR